MHESTQIASRNCGIESGCLPNRCLSHAARTFLPEATSAPTEPVRCSASAALATILLLLGTASGSTCHENASRHASVNKELRAGCAIPSLRGVSLVAKGRSPLDATAGGRFIQDDCPTWLVEQAAYIDCLDRGADLATAAGDPAQASHWRTMANDAWADAEATWEDAQLGCFAQSCGYSQAEVVGYLLDSGTEVRADPFGVGERDNSRGGS